MPNPPTGSKQIDVEALANSSALLAEYTEDSLREYFLSLAHMYKSAKFDDAQFKEICQDRAGAYVRQGKLFSTCGEWCHFLLERAGYRGPILNRDLFDAAGQKIRSWEDGKNIYKLFMTARKEGAFVEYLLSHDRNKRPKPGDLCYVAVAGKPATEHVFMNGGTAPQDDSRYEHWISIDGGQGGISDQRIAEVSRVFDTHTGELMGAAYVNGKYIPKTSAGRPLIGWVDISLLTYTADANLRTP